MSDHVRSYSQSEFCKVPFCMTADAQGLTSRVAMTAANPIMSEIQALPAHIDRPRWSVMIPTYNCAKYLRQTLESVLAQDPGPEQMQIEVVDDCSTMDDPAAVVREIGEGRVSFHRKAANSGATTNFNSCIERSRGHLVHILHGDDYVLPGFYRRIAKLADGSMNCALFATRCFFVDEEGVILGVTERLRELEQASKRADDFFYTTPIQTPGVVVRRSFYESNGGFRPSLVHTADCEMWARAVSAGQGVIASDVLACYRTFSTNDSGRLSRMAENLRDIERLNAVFANSYAAFDSRRGLQRLCYSALSQAERFTKNKDKDAENENMAFFRSRAPFSIKLKYNLRRMLRALR